MGAELDSKLQSAEELLGRFTERGILQEFEHFKNRNLHAAQRVIDLYHQRELYRFDIFRIAGFVADELSLSNAVAALLDPGRPHRLGTAPFKKMLEAVQHRDISRISAILKAVDETGAKIRVHRELRLTSSIPDIALISDKFVVFIENKVRGGIETEKLRVSQTCRQWRDLKSFGGRLGIPEERLLGIFLTPEGGFASEGCFLPLSVAELIWALRMAVDEANDCKSAQAIHAFLNFYESSSY